MPQDNQYTDSALPYTGLPIVWVIVAAVVITAIGVYLRYR